MAPSHTARGIIRGIVRRVALEIALLLDHGFTRLPRVAQRAFGAVVRIGENLLGNIWVFLVRVSERAWARVTGQAGRAANDMEKKVGGAITGMIKKIGSFIARVGVVKTIIDGIVSAFQTVVSWIQQAINKVKELISNIANIHMPSFSLPSLPSWLHPHTGGVVTDHGLYLASGGVAQGRRGSDTIPAMLTPGEIVLNHDQQMRLFRLLNSDAQRVVAPDHVTPAFPQVSVQQTDMSEWYRGDTIVNVDISRDVIAGIARVEVIQGERRQVRRLKAKTRL